MVADVTSPMSAMFSFSQEETSWQGCGTSCTEPAAPPPASVPMSGQQDSWVPPGDYWPGTHTNCRQNRLRSSFLPGCSVLVLPCRAWYGPRMDLTAQVKRTILRMGHGAWENSCFLPGSPYSRPWKPQMPPGSYHQHLAQAIWFSAQGFLPHRPKSLSVHTPACPC